MSQPKKSVHHVTPLSNMFLGHQEVNLLEMNHDEHRKLHHTCDLKTGYTTTMNQLYAQINSDIVISLESVDELYKHLGYFFQDFEELPYSVRVSLGENWKNILTYHLNQRGQVTNSDEQYRLLKRKYIKDRGVLSKHKDIELVIAQDKALLKTMVQELRSFLLSKGITNELLHRSTQQHPKAAPYLVPLRLRGRADTTNRLFKNLTLHENIKKQAMYNNGINVRGARGKTNGTYIFGSQEWDLRYTLQHKYMLNVEKVVETEYDESTWNYYTRKMNQQLGQTIEKRNKLQKKVGQDDFYKQRYSALHDMHHESSQLLGRYGDVLKNLLRKERRLVG